MMSRIWKKSIDGYYLVKKEVEPELIVKVYMRDARWHFTIFGRVGTKYENFFVRNSQIPRKRRGWKNLANAKEQALSARWKYKNWWYPAYLKRAAEECG